MWPYDHFRTRENDLRIDSLLRSVPRKPQEPVPAARSSTKAIAAELSYDVVHAMGGAGPAI